MELDKLKTDVVSLLTTEHEYLLDEAEALVDESVAKSPSIWNDNADPDSLAKFLDSDDDDE
jgi:hypothetical protein